ncbi:MAG: hypothetical protein PF693_15080 [Spirochaetia bacterium]|nr:hypothetical protein [Spirochaetia bacterium]
MDLILLLRNQTKFEKELKSISYNEPNIKNSLIIGAIDLDKLNTELDEYKYKAVISSNDNWQKIDIYNPEGKTIDYNEASLTRLSKYEWTKAEIRELISCP